MPDVWRNNIERDSFIDRYCRVCFQPDEALRRIVGAGEGCPHLARAEQNRLPTAWTRRRNATLGETYRCKDFAKTPPVNRRAVVDVDIEPMIEVEPDDHRLVPVESWPDYRAEAKEQKEGKHS